MPLDLEGAKAWRAAQGNQEADSSVESLRRERIRLVQSQRRKIDIENRQRDGRLIEVGEVTATFYNVASTARSRLLSFAGTLPPRLAGLDELAIAKILREEVHAVLDELSNANTYEKP